jgi:hypothetical protein
MQCQQIHIKLYTSNRVFQSYVELREVKETLLEVHNVIRVCRHYIEEFFRAEASYAHLIGFRDLRSPLKRFFCVMSTDTYQVNRVFRYFAQLLRALVCNVNRYISSYTHLIGFP